MNINQKVLDYIFGNASEEERLAVYQRCTLTLIYLEFFGILWWIAWWKMGNLSEMAMNGFWIF